MASGKLTTHILDTANGRPAAGVRITLARIEGEMRQKMGEFLTNDDGRTDRALIPQGALQAGEYELSFEIGEYFEAQADPQSRGFLGTVPIRFHIADADAHYHVPLLVSPFGYSTYRGS